MSQRKKAELVIAAWFIAAQLIMGGMSLAAAAIHGISWSGIWTFGWILTTVYSCWAIDCISEVK